MTGKRRRIWRWMWNGAVIVSLLMMVGVSAGLVTSYWRILMIDREHVSNIPTGDLRRHRVIIQADSMQVGWGCFHVVTNSTESLMIPEQVGWGLKPDSPAQTLKLKWGFDTLPIAQPVPAPTDPLFHYGGIRYWQTGIGSRTTGTNPSGGFYMKLRRLDVPLYYPLALTAILPTVWFILWYRGRAKRLPGHCRACGYNLTGTLAAGRTECPECGAGVKGLDRVVDSR